MVCWETERIGFLLIQDGFDILGRLPDNLSFVAPRTTTAADLDSGVPPVLRSTTLGAFTGAAIFYSFSTLNPGDANKLLFGVASGGRELQLGFQDLPGASGYNDFQDVVVGIRCRWMTFWLSSRGAASRRCRRRAPTSSSTGRNRGAD